MNCWRQSMDLHGREKLVGFYLQALWRAKENLLGILAEEREKSPGETHPSLLLNKMLVCGEDFTRAPLYLRETSCQTPPDSLKLSSTHGDPSLGTPAIEILRVNYKEIEHFQPPPPHQWTPHIIKIDCNWESCDIQISSKEELLRSPKDIRGDKNTGARGIWTIWHIQIK